MEFDTWYNNYCSQQNRNPATNWLMSDMLAAWTGGYIGGYHDGAEAATVAQQEAAELARLQPLVNAAKTFAKDQSFENMQDLVSVAEKLES